MARLNHLGIIPDGNRRWARKNNLPYADAYWIAMNHLVALLDEAYEHGIDNISVYLLSSENLKRNDADLADVMAAEKRLCDELLPSRLSIWQCGVVHAGNLSILPASFAASIRNVCSSSRERDYDRRLYLLIGYNPADEIISAARQAQDLASLIGGLSVPSSVDLVIRTGGGNLLSNFLPLQCGYAHIATSAKMFGEYTIEDLRLDINQFEKIIRLRGK